MEFLIQVIITGSLCFLFFKLVNHPSNSIKKKWVKDKKGHWEEVLMTNQEIDAEKKTNIQKKPKFEKYYNPNFSHLVRETKTQYPSNSFDNFIAGRMSLAKMFWLYFIFIGIILSIMGGYFYALGYPIIIIFPIAYYALVSVALWNCATLYQNEKLTNRQSYGWAIGVKILIVLNIVMTVIQIWLNFITK